MIVHYQPGSGLSLREADDFRAFKVVLADGAQARPEVAGLLFVDDGNALVGRDVVPALPGAPATTEWQDSYDRMVAAAGRFGWIDEATGAIRAHVERA